MSIIDSLIFDRTQADVSSLEALLDKTRAGTITAEEWAQLVSPDHKGAYNYTDLNRVTEAMEYISDLLEGLGYSTAGYRSASTMWTEGDTPTSSDMAEYLANVAALRGSLPQLSTTPQTPASMDKLTVETANSIEKILVDIETIIRSMMPITPKAAQPLLFCGFAVYVKHPDMDVDPYLSVCTVDGLPVYTANGLLVQVKSQ